MMQKQPAAFQLLHTAVLILLSAFSVSVLGTPSINLPINAQVPPVARPNQAYNFVFSESSFSWTGSSITYSLTNYSGWLQLDGSSRVFSGTPGSADAGSFAVTLVATDQTGSSSTTATFVVSTDPGPGLGTSVAEQLPAFGVVPSPDSLSLAPSSALSLSFSPNTFTNTNENTVYYAICANNTPLPSWVDFHPSSLTFSGTTPSSTSPSELPQAFRIQLIASNVLGFAEAVASFQLVIASHIFTFGNSLHFINITNGMLVNFLGLQHDLTLDGQPANPSDLRQVVANTPPWMSFNSSTLALSGTPPANAASQNFTVIASDIYGDTTSTIVLLQNIDNLDSSFTGPFGTVNATIGANFTYDLSPNIVSNSTADVAVTFGAASVWLSFDSSSLEIRGFIPINLMPQSIQIMVTITQGTQSQSQNLTINIQNANAPSARTISSHSTSPKATPDSTARGNRTIEESRSKSRPKDLWIAAAIIVPILVTLGSLLLLCLYLRRMRRRKADQDSLKSPRRKISRPIQEKDTPNIEAHAGTPEFLPINENRASSRASKSSWLDILGFQKLGHNNRGSQLRLSDGSISSIEHSTRRGSRGYYFPGRAEGKPVPEVSRMSEKRRSRNARKTLYGFRASPLAVQRLSVIMDDSPTKRHSKVQKRGSNVSYDTTSAFPYQRLSGMGHGRNSVSQSNCNFRLSSSGVGHGNGLASGPPGFGRVRKSWRNMSRSTWASTDGSSEPRIEREATVGRSRSNARPPMLNSFGKSSHSNVIHEISDDEGPRKPTLRPVLSITRRHSRRKSGSPSRPQSNLLKTDPLQSFHKRRLQPGNSCNPLFSAGPSSFRISSIRASKPAPLEINPSPSDSPGNNTVPECPTTPRTKDTWRSYSESSSLDPPVRPSPSSTRSSPQHQKSYIKYNLNARALSPPKFSLPLRMNSRGSSWISTSSDSKFGSAASEAAPFGGFGEDLREETDEDGNKRWLRGHPNPLGTHRLDVTDQEFIDQLRVSGQVSAAQRLSYLMRAQMEGKADSGTESGDEGGQMVKVGSPRGKRLGQSVGLRQGSPGNRSMKGDIGNNTTAGSAFI